MYVVHHTHTTLHSIICCFLFTVVISCSTAVVALFAATASSTIYAILRCWFCCFVFFFFFFVGKAIFRWCRTSLARARSHTQQLPWLTYAAMDWTDDGRLLLRNDDHEKRKRKETNVALSFCAISMIHSFCGESTAEPANSGPTWGINSRPKNRNVFMSNDSFCVAEAKQKRETNNNITSMKLIRLNIFIFHSLPLAHSRERRTRPFKCQ